MSWTAVFQLTTAIIASLGGGGAIVVALSSFLGKLWAKRALEEEKHRYAEMLQTAKSELDKAASRYQAQLDALGHIHTLRTDEEFMRLGKLWRHMAILQVAFRDAARPRGMLEAAPETLIKLDEDNRRYFENVLFEARKFFLEEKLFIPEVIAERAESTLHAAGIGDTFYFMFLQDHDEITDRQQPFLAEFDSGMTELEKLMRDHIGGQRLVQEQLGMIDKAEGNHDSGHLLSF
jgi:hypothetical protein